MSNESRIGIADQLQNWLDWDKDQRKREYLTTDDGTHIMSLPVPYWPTHGALKAWIEIIRQHQSATLQSKGQNFTIDGAKLYNKTSEIPMQHNQIATDGESDNNRPSEIPVNRDLLLTAIYHDIEAETLGNGHPVPTETVENLAQSIMGTIEPYLATREPDKCPDCGADMLEVCSDLESVRRESRPVSIKDVSNKVGNEMASYRYGHCTREYAIKAVLDAAGVKHVD